ncbi:MAG: hypothetical protein K5927_00005, partial [Lachnospiraceae bacterium]|nr:hypothetical protein [Lachnospiraceae bacterium]
IHRGASGDKSSGHLGYAWDSFALCFYDFKVNPLYDALAAGEDDSENVYYEMLTEENKTSTFATNDSAENITINKTRSESTTSTTSNTVSASKTLSYTESAGITYTHQIGKPPYATSWSVNVNFSAAQSDTSTESNTTGESSTHTDTFTVSGIAKPGTQLCLNQSNATSRGAVSYSCPVAYQYKVAVLSICGDYSGALPNRHVNVKHSGVARIFGKDNGDALADLKDKYDNPSYDNFGLDWSVSSPVKSHLDDNRFYSSIGGTMTFVIKNYLSAITPLTPLHALNRTDTDKSKSTYTIVLSEDRPNENRVNLGAVDVTGSSLLGDGSLIPYYGFDKSKGCWKLCDETGELLADSEYAEIQNTVAGTFLVAKKASVKPVYLMYYINDDTYPAFPGNPDKADVFMKNSDLSANAVIEVYIYDTSNGEGFFGGEESEPMGDASPVLLLVLLAAATLAVTAFGRKKQN